MHGTKKQIWKEKLFNSIKLRFVMKVVEEKNGFDVK